nr:hypothetical protein [uncultured bacterium]
MTHEFSDSVPFVTYKREGGVASGTRFEIDKGALKISNAYAGSFGIDTKTPAFDAVKFGHLTFDYLIPPVKDRNQSVKVNFFIRVKGVYHGVNFTGPPEVRPGSVFLGTIPKVLDDGQWHRVHLPLRDWLRKLYPRDETLPVDEIIVGNWNPANYLMAGIGGNGAGASWEMDNFAINGVGPGEAKFTVQDEPGKPVAKPESYSWSLDGGAATALKTAEITVAADNGFHLLQLLDAAKKVVADYGFFVGKDAPVAGKLRVVRNTLEIPIETSAGLNLKTAKLTVGDRVFESDSPYLIWDGAAGVLELDAGNAGLVWKDGQQVPVSLEGTTDLLGRALPTFQSTLAVDYSTLKTPPAWPQLAALKTAGNGTFEETADEWASKTDSEGPAIVERDHTTRATGRYSLRLTSPINSSTSAAWVRRTPFEVAKFPAIEFDYRLSPDVRMDFLISAGGITYSIGFTDRTTKIPRIGQIAGVKADNEWHHARIDLQSLLQGATPPITAPTVDWIVITDSDYLGNARGDQYWIDNFQMVPAITGAFTSQVSLADVTGIKALSWVLNNEIATVPPATVKESGDVVNVSGTGLQWLHLRVQNGAGQWSETSNWPLMFAAPPATPAPPAAP